MPFLHDCPAATQPTPDKWPSKPINYVVPFAAGGTTDVLGRLIGQRLSVALGQPVVVENRAGAGGNIGSDYVAKAAPDGYTLVGGTISSHAINVSLYPRMPYDPVKQFQPVALIGTLPNVLVVNADSPWKSVQDVIAAARVPAQVTFGSSGNGTSQHRPASSSPSWRTSSCCTCPTRAAARPCRPCSASRSTRCSRTAWRPCH